MLRNEIVELSMKPHQLLIGLKPLILITVTVFVEVLLLHLIDFDVVQDLLKRFNPRSSEQRSRLLNI